MLDKVIYNQQKHFDKPNTHYSNIGPYFVNGEQTPTRFLMSENTDLGLKRRRFINLKSAYPPIRRLEK